MASPSRPEPAPAKAAVDQFLVATLTPGDIVIMDYLGSHKGAGVRAAIEAAGAKSLYLPPYSPDFNPTDPSTGSGGLLQTQGPATQGR